MSFLRTAENLHPFMSWRTELVTYETNACLLHAHGEVDTKRALESHAPCLCERTNVCIGLRLWFMQRMIFSLSMPARGYNLWIFIIAGALHTYFDNSDSFTFPQPSDNKKPLKPFHGLCQGMQIVAMLEQRRAQILHDSQWRRWLRAIREWYCPAGADCWGASGIVPFRPEFLASLLRRSINASSLTSMQC